MSDITQGYYRYPSVFGDTVVFVSDDDIWSAPLSGGVARRLTASLGHVSRPLHSPDGQTLAFTATEEGHAEVYAMPAEGGPIRRLTHLGATSRVVAWKDGRIVFSTNCGQPFWKIYELWTVGPEGGAVERLPWGPADALAAEGEAVIIGRNVGDPARWKRYRGGRTGQIWIDRKGTSDFERLSISDLGNTASPMIAGGRVFFLSDHEGVGNIYSCDLSGGDVRRHTRHKDFYARNPATDGKRIVYHCGGDLWLLDVEAGAKSRRLEIRVPSPRTQRARKFVEAVRYLEDYDPSPDGGAWLEIVARGQSFAMGCWEGPPARQEGGADADRAVRHRLARWLDEERVILVSDVTGEDRLEIHPGPGGDALKRFESLDAGRPMSLKVSPQGDRVALSNHRHELLIVHLETGEAKVVDRSEHSAVEGFDWSPDGRWLAYGCSVGQRQSVIKIYSLETGESRPVTEPVLRDFQPAFDPEGRYLYFLSARFLDPVYDQLHFDAGFPRGMRPCLIALRKDVPSPFLAEKPEGFGSKSKKKKDKDKDKKKSVEEKRVEEISEEPRKENAPEPESSEKEEEKPEETEEKEEIGASKIEIDFDGIFDRVLSFPVDEGIYHQIGATSERVFYLSSRPKGSLDRNIYRKAPPKDKTIYVFDLKEREEETFAESVTDFTLSRDRGAMAIRAGNQIRVVKADAKAGSLSKDRSATRKTGWADLSRLGLEVDPGKEWLQMLREAWRLQRDYFWNENMSGVDWQSILLRYEPLVSRVSTRAEFSDLLWEMQGELGTSHAYELGGDYRSAPEYHIGILGADLSLDAERDAYRIDHIVRGDPWSREAAPPLLRPGLNLRDGMLLLAVDGRKVGKSRHPNEILVHRSGELVRLLVANPDGSEPRTVVVETLEDETPLRYRDWVNRNRDFVREKSGGKIGYVHIPNMGPAGYAEFHRHFLAEFNREGLLVDVRFNGGGHVSSLLLEKLNRKRIGYDVPRWMKPSPYPEESLRGPILCLTNEQAGSDGDIFSRAFKKMRLGKLAGTRTWGGVVGIWPRNWLVDGGITTQPEFAMWDIEEEWGLENFGVAPDVWVDNSPQDGAAGRDAQLEKALEMIMEEVRQNPPPPIPDFGNRPNLAAPAFPEESSTQG
jgi:tricorn protease